MKLLHLHRAEIAKPSTDTAFVYQEFLTAVNPALVAFVGKAGFKATVATGQGGELRDVTIVRADGFSLFSMESPFEIVTRWQKALDGYPPQKADDSTGTSESSSTGARVPNS